MLVSALVEWLGGERWGRAVRVLAPLGALAIEGWPALVGALLVQEGGLWLAQRCAGACQRAFVRKLFLAAYGLRVVIALPAHVVAKRVDGNGALFWLFSDDYTNDLVGEWLMRIARNEGSFSIFPGHQHLLDGLYSYLLMGLYATFGYAPLLPKLLNVGLAALSAVLIFELARRAFNARAAVLAALGAAFLPTMIIWSVATLKETLVLCLALLGLLLLQFLSAAAGKHPRLADAMVLETGILALLFDLRASTGLILLVLLVVIMLARLRLQLRPRAWQLALAAVAVIGLVGGGVWFYRVRTSDRPFSTIAEDVALQIRHRRAQEGASARSQLRPESGSPNVTGSELPAAEAASDAAPFSLTGDVLDPLVYALFAPAPWQARTLQERGASAEMAVWYGLLAASLLAWRAASRQPLFVICLALYGGASWFVLAASEGNLGNLLRHRLLLDPVLLILGAAGLEWLWVRAGRPLSSRIPLVLVPARGDT